MVIIIEPTTDSDPVPLHRCTDAAGFTNYVSVDLNRLRSFRVVADVYGL